VVECVAALCHTRHGTLAKSTSERFSAANDDEAKAHARAWARSFDFVADDVLLEVNADGRRIYIIRRAEF
jgi:hypothetical protein